MSSEPARTRSVYMAEPYRDYATGSSGTARGMLLRQWRFPAVYDAERDAIYDADHDRIVAQDHARWSAACRRHIPKSVSGFESWIKEGRPEKIMAFVIDALRPGTSRKITGFRVLVTVNRATGYSIYSLQLFSRGRGSGTKVYSKLYAPNVLGYDPRGNSRTAWIVEDPTSRRMTYNHRVRHVHHDAFDPLKMEGKMP